MVNREVIPMGFLYEAMDRANEAILNYYGGNRKKK